MATAGYYTNTWLWRVGFIVITMMVLNYALPYLLTRPGDAMAGIDGDAAKNYFTVIYHSLHGDGFWMMGMNYPYGEHTTYVDGQPLISVPLSYLRHCLPLSATQVLGIMHLLIFLSYFLGVVYVYKLLRYYRLPRWIGLFFALLIICMSPQVTRAYAHFGLSYACILPMVLYWSVQYYDTDRLRFVVYLFLLGCLSSLLHPYWAGMLLIWCGLCALAFLLMRGLPKRTRFRQAGGMVAVAAGVFLFVKFLMLATDRVTDRSIDPGGFFDYLTHANDVLTSPMSPIWEALRQHDIFTSISAGGEGYAYIGLAAMVILLASFLIAIINKFNNKIIIHPGATLSPVWLFVAIGALVFACGIPFIWGLEGLLDLVPALRQFRSLGRFSWIFYYIITIYTVVCLWRLYIDAKHQGRHTTAIAILLLPALLWVYEAQGIIGHYRDFTRNMPEKKREFFGEDGKGKWTTALQSKGYQPSDFQAVMMVPFIHLGTDKIYLETRHTLWTIGLTMRASIETGLPMMNMYASRSSWSRAFAQAQLMGGPYVEKPSLQLLPNSKPILMLVSAEDSLSPDEKYVLQSAAYISAMRDCHLYALYPQRLMQADSMLQVQAREWAALMQTGDTCIGCEGRGWQVKHYDELLHTNNLWSAGSIVLQGDVTELATIPIRPSADSLYEFSAWVLVDKGNTKVPKGVIYVLDSTGAELQQFPFTAAEAKDFSGLWFRMGVYMPVDRRGRMMKCVLQNSSHAYRLDELLLRPASATVISQIPQSKTVMVNNHLLLKR